ncbi:MAG: IS4 family transposase [Myxococcota bacterium]
MEVITEQWIEEELECFQVGDERLHRLAKHILAGQCANPTRTFYAGADSQAAAKATYRFQKNTAVNQQGLLDSHVHKVKQRMADHPVVLCVNDTTQLNFATQSAKENRGTLSSSSSPIGYLAHPLVAFTPNKLCLGVLDCKVWSRPPQDYGKKHQRSKKPLQEKESFRWIQTYRHTNQLQKAFSHTRLIYVADRESDLYKLFVETTAPQSAGMIVRATHDRKVKGEGKRLREYLRTCPNSFVRKIAISPRDNQPARTAIVKVFYDRVELQAPCPSEGAAVAMGAVLVRESGAPSNATPLHWLLLTTASRDKFRRGVACGRVLHGPLANRGFLSHAQNGLSRGA